MTIRNFDLIIKNKQDGINELMKMKDTVLILYNKGSIQRNEFVERDDQFNTEISKIDDQIVNEKNNLTL